MELIFVVAQYGSSCFKGKKYYSFPKGCIKDVHNGYRGGLNGSNIFAWYYFLLLYPYKTLGWWDISQRKGVCLANAVMV